MDEVKKIGSEIFNSRKERIMEIDKEVKKREEEKKRLSKDYILSILQVFNASNLEETEKLIWKLRVQVNNNMLECSVAFLESQKDMAFYYITHPEIKKMKKVENTMEILNDLKVSMPVINSMDEIFEENGLDEYFYVDFITNGFIIHMNNPLICEKEESEE